MELKILSPEAIREARLRSEGFDDLAQWRAVAQTQLEDTLGQAVELIEARLMLKEDGIYVSGKTITKALIRVLQELQEQAVGNG